MKKYRNTVSFDKNIGRETASDLVNDSIREDLGYYRTQGVLVAMKENYITGIEEYEGELIISFELEYEAEKEVDMDSIVLGGAF